MVTTHMLDLPVSGDKRCSFYLTNLFVLGSLFANIMSGGFFLWVEIP